MLLRIIVAGCVASSWPAMLLAQEIGPALNPTTMMGYAGTSAARQYTERHYGVSRGGASTDKSAQARQICSHLADYAVRPNATPARMQRLAATCRMAGY